MVLELIQLIYELAIALQYCIHLQGLSGHTVTLSDHAEKMWGLHVDEVDLDPFCSSSRLNVVNELLYGSS